jgi:hypothetical protein
VKKTTSDNSVNIPAPLWRRQPPRAATRLRCAIAMGLLAVAVIVAAIPALANRSGCPGIAQDTPGTLFLQIQACTN